MHRLCKVNGAYTGSVEAVLDAGDPSPRVFIKDLTQAYPSFEELSIRRFPVKYFDAEVMLPRPADGVDDGQILKLQANFISGALILCAMVHHSFADAQGLAVIVEQLGVHLVAGQAAPKLSAESIDRSPLFMKFPPDQPIKWARDHVRSEMSPQFELAKNPGVTGQIFRCSFAAMKELKAQVSGLLTNSDGWISTTDALSAFIWICVTFACHDGAHDSQKWLHFFLNGRAKFENPLPNSYVGNCVLACQVVRQASQLLARSRAADECSEGGWPDRTKFEEIIASIAVDIRREIIRCDEDRIREHIEAIYHYSDIRYNVGGGKFPVDHMGISSLFDLATYSVDLGGILGKAAAVRLPDNQVDGMSFILPKSSEDSLDYCLWLEDDSMQRLMKNPVWNELFTPIE